MSTGRIDVNFADRTQTSVGDLIFTRSTDRRLPTSRGGWISKGDR
jgi:hypothetical protein